MGIMFYLMDKTEDLHPEDSLLNHGLVHRVKRSATIYKFLQQKEGSWNIKRFLLIQENLT